MGGGITWRPKRGGHRHGARVELLLHGVFRLVRYLDELIEVLLHARLVGKGNIHILGHTARREDGLWPTAAQTSEAVGSHLEGPLLEDWEQERPCVKTRVEVVERPSVTDQLVGIRQDFERLSRLTLVAIIGVPVYLRHDGVDVVIGYLMRLSFNPSGMPQWPCSIRAKAKRRLLVAASIKASSLMTGTPSRVPRDGGLKYVRGKGDGPATSMSGSSAAWSSAPSG